jgi:hypothetical protein
MAGAIIGVIKGHRWMMDQGWKIQDRFRNTSRDQMPEDETLTRFGDRMVALAGRVIAENGGSAAGPVWRIRTQAPANLAPLASAEKRAAELRAQLGPEIERDVMQAAGAQRQARAAYLAICLDLAPALAREHAAEWKRAVAALSGYPQVLRAMFEQSPVPAGERLREKALAAGVPRPAPRK